MSKTSARRDLFFFFKSCRAPRVLPFSPTRPSSDLFAGELRQGNSMKTANRMGAASMAILVSVIVFVAIFFHSFGKDFLTAANAGGLSSKLGNSVIGRAHV